MGIYVIKKDAMVKLLREYFPMANDLATEIIPGAVKIGMKVNQHFFFIILFITYTLYLIDKVGTHLLYLGSFGFICFDRIFHFQHRVFNY